MSRPELPQPERAVLPGEQAGVAVLVEHVVAAEARDVVLEHAEAVGVNGADEHRRESIAEGRPLHLGHATDDALLATGVYLAMRVVTWDVIVPLAFASLVIGIVQSLGTPWGLFRHYWIIIKLVLTMIAVAVLMLQTPSVNALSDAALYVNGFSVDKTGSVQLPTVGRLKLQGLTMSEAQELVQRKINDYFTNATVILKMVSFRVSVLGDVNTPGSYFIYNNQITLLDALARAGGPREYADKRHVTLMRQSDQGTQALYVDLSKANVASSEYYYLLPNDVVYVPTLKARPGRMNLELLGILFSAVSAAALVVTVLNQNK